MKFLSTIRTRLSPITTFFFGAIAGLIALVIIVHTVDGSLLRKAASQAANEPTGILLALATFAIAFIFRAFAWQKVMPNLSFNQALGGIHLALGANHVLPLRIGETFRVFSVVRRHKANLESATASTVALRTGDILAIGCLGLIAAPSAFTDLLGWIGWILLAILGIIALSCWRWLKHIIKRRDDIRMPGPTAFLLSVIAWIAESVLVWKTAQWAGLEISWPAAIFVTTVAVAAQIIAIAPGGFGTYEAAAVAAYVAIGQDAELALIAAISAHALKTAYSLLAGLIAIWVPSPAIFGNLRLSNSPTLKTKIPNQSNAPILLFMPAHNEEASIANCLNRVPKEVCGKKVEVLVIDDGSTDRTAEIATANGAEVLSLGSNCGLGAAVRVGLGVGVDKNASVIAFCDADGEYPPEELSNLVSPILKNEADYVIGSRFMGHIEHMHPHRRLGNVVLTSALSLVARRKITDGQSGYRAFSPEAAANAEIIHNFNYAQVLTLNLLGKGYRYLEVPISYHFRTEGKSFIKLGPYLRNVLPAVYNEINR